MFKGIRPLNQLIKIPSFKYDTGATTYICLFNPEGILEKDVFRSVMGGNYISVFDGPL